MRPPNKRLERTAEKRGRSAAGRYAGAENVSPPRRSPLCQNRPIQGRGVSKKLHEK